MHDIRFSQDSRHVLYAARTGDDEETLFVDGVPQALHYRYVLIPVFSPDGAGVAYSGTKGTQGDIVLVRDSVESPKGGPLSEITFSPDGKHLAAIRQEGAGKAVILDDKKDPPHQNIGGLMFSADSRHLAYEVVEDNKQFMVIDGKAQTGRAILFYFRYSPRGSRYVYAQYLSLDFQGGMIGVIDGAEIGPFSEIGPASFSDDGSRLAFALSKTKDSPTVLWVDSVEQKPAVARVRQIVFSPDAKHLAYSVEYDALQAARNQAVILDGAPQLIYDGISNATFSPDSRHFAYTAFRRGEPRDGERVLLDGVEGRIYRAVSQPVFSSDSLHCAYLATDNDKSFAVVDGQETQKLDGLFNNLHARPFFDSPSSFHFLGQDAGEIVRVDVRLKTAK